MVAGHRSARFSCPTCPSHTIDRNNVLIGGVSNGLQAVPAASAEARLRHLVKAHNTVEKGGPIAGS